MDNDRFVNDIIKNRMKNQELDSMLSILKKPGGRSPHKEIVENSKWYNSLSENDKIFLARVIGKTVDMVLFGFLAMLDGVSLIADNDHYELYAIDKETGKKTLLNDPEKEELHCLYNTD